MARAQRFASSHEIRGPYTSKSPQIRQLDVQATWDGLSEHPAHVRIHCTIKPGSGFRIPVLECDGERGVVISIMIKQNLKPDHAGGETTTSRQYSDMFSGETLTVANANLFLKDSFMVTPSMTVTTIEQKSHSLALPDDIFSDGPVWANDVPGFVRETSASAIGESVHQRPKIEDKRAVRLVLSGSTNDGKRSTSADTVEIHLLSRPSSPFGADGLGPSNIIGQGNPEGACDRVFDLSDALADGSPRKLRVKKRAKHSKRQVGKGKRPWETPSRQDFSPKSKDPITAQLAKLSCPTYDGAIQTRKSSKLNVPKGPILRNSDAKSMEPLRQSSGNCLGAGTTGTSPRLRQPSSALGRLRSKTPQKMEENAAISTKPFLSERRARKPIFNESVLSFKGDGDGQGWINIFEDLRDQDNKGSSPHILTPTRSPLGFASQLHPQQPSPATCMRIREPSKTGMPHNSGNSQQSSPTPCVRNRDRSKTYMLHYSGQKPEVDSDPTWVIEDGKLVICFPEASTLTPFEIDIEAEVHLVSMDGHDWHSFSLAVCSDLDRGNVSGSLSLKIEPALGQSESPDAQFRSECLFDTQVVAANHITGKFLIAEALQVALRFKQPILNIPFYTLEVKLCGTAIWSDEDGFQINYCASLNIDHPDYDFYADQIVLHLNIKNRSLCTDTYYLGGGETSVFLRDDHQLLDSPLSGRIEASLAIIRDAADIGLPLEIVFTVSYGRTSPITVALPQIYPADGKVVSESIFIIDSSPGLSVEHRASASFSTWKTTEHVRDDVRILQFDRNPIPFAFPEGLKEDVLLKLVRQAPVHFKALEEPSDPVANVTLDNVIRNFKLDVAEMLGGGLECRMTLEIHVTECCRLLTIDHHDWNPKLSIVDGRLATEDAAEWRETIDGNSTLFKSERVVPGQTVRVEFSWDEWDILEEFEEDDCKNFVVYNLPRVVGKTVLGGLLQCNVKGGTVTLDDGVGQTVYRSIDRLGLNKVRLPTLRDGYKMVLGFRRDRHTTCYAPPRLEYDLATSAIPPKILFAGGMPLASRQVQFRDELSEDSSDAVDDISAAVVEDSDSESIFSSEFDENPPPPLTMSTKDERVMTWSTVLFRKKRSSIRRVMYHYRWSCILGLGIALLLKLRDQDFAAAKNVLNYVEPFLTHTEQLALSVFPVPMDDATLFQVPRQHTANNGDESARVHEWVLSAVSDGQVGTQAPGAGSRGDTEMAYYKSYQVTDVDSTKDGTHSATGQGGTGHNRSVRDWIDYTLGWRGEA